MTPPPPTELSLHRVRFMELWHGKIRPRIAQMTGVFPKNRTPAEIAMDIAKEAAWVAYREGK